MNIHNLCTGNKEPRGHETDFYRVLLLAYQYSLLRLTCWVCTVLPSLTKSTPSCILVSSMPFSRNTSPLHFQLSKLLTSQWNCFLPRHCTVITDDKIVVSHVWFCGKISNSHNISYYIRLQIFGSMINKKLYFTYDFNAKEGFYVWWFCCLFFSSG